MVDSLQTFHPVVQALMATCFTWLVTALGAAGVFLTRGARRLVLDGHARRAMQLALTCGRGLD